MSKNGKIEIYHWKRLQKHYQNGYSTYFMSKDLKCTKRWSI